jgi:predicted AlkP superfamily phosphohydrolase/phosphomutase
MALAKRALFLGFDALVLNTFERFLGEGVLPNFERLLAMGSKSRIRSVIPAQTPTNWTTLATGATPGTHGIVQWGSHIPGEPLEEYHREDAFTSGLCRAEYLWETAARHGMTSVVFNYAGYPPTVDEATHIEWLFKPAQSYFDLATAALYHNCPELNTTDPIELTPAEDWANPPESGVPALQTEMAVVTVTPGSGPTYRALVFGDSEYDTLLIAADKDAAGAVATLKVGEWSEWLRADFATEDQGDAEGAFRFKLVELAADGSRVRVFRTDAFPADGRFCSNPELGRRLIEELGPYVHAGQACMLNRDDALEFDVVDEIMAWESEWWPQAVQIAMEQTDAQLLYLHWHLLDAMGHTFVEKVDPTAGGYDAENVEYYWDIIRGYYRSADRLLGRFLDLFDDGDTTFVVCSDHGMPGNRRAASLVNAFRGEDWLTYADDGKSVDWEKSKVFWAQNHLWINLQGRDEGGVVPPEEYEELRARVLAKMRAAVDPETGEHVLAFALAREDAPMVGLWGDYIGDIVFVYSGGYTWSGDEVLRMGEERVAFPCTGGNHGPMIPTYETETTSVMGAMVIGGAGVQPGVTAPRLDQFRLCTTDVAPTIAHLLGIEPPAQSEGRIMHELLVDGYAERPERTLVETARPVVTRKRIKPQPLRLQGDVTDEV